MLPAQPSFLRPRLPRWHSTAALSARAVTHASVPGRSCRGAGRSELFARTPPRRPTAHGGPPQLRAAARAAPARPAVRDEPARVDPAEPHRRAHRGAQLPAQAVELV